MQIDFIEPWAAIGSERERTALEDELRRELSPHDALSNFEVQAIGRRVDCDDVLFEVCDGKADFQLVIVHLTWSRQVESSSWPTTNQFADAPAFIIQMMHDAQEYD